jgi:hypothetical protein
MVAFSAIRNRDQLDFLPIFKKVDQSIPENLENLVASSQTILG